MLLHIYVESIKIRAFPDLANSCPILFEPLRIRSRGQWHDLQWPERQAYQKKRNKRIVTRHDNEKQQRGMLHGNDIHGNGIYACIIVSSRKTEIM